MGLAAHDLHARCRSTAYRVGAAHDPLTRIGPIRRAGARGHNRPHPSPHGWSFSSTHTPSCCPACRRWRLFAQPPSGAWPAAALPCWPRPGARGGAAAAVAGRLRRFAPAGLPGPALVSPRVCVRALCGLAPSAASLWPRLPRPRPLSGFGFASPLVGPWPSGQRVALRGAPFGPACAASGPAAPGPAPLAALRAAVPPFGGRAVLLRAAVAACWRFSGCCVLRCLGFAGPCSGSASLPPERPFSACPGALRRAPPAAPPPLPPLRGSRGARG